MPYMLVGHATMYGKFPPSWDFRPWQDKELKGGPRIKRSSLPTPQKTTIPNMSLNAQGLKSLLVGHSVMYGCFPHKLGLQTLAR